MRFVKTLHARPLMPRAADLCRARGKLRQFAPKHAALSGAAFRAVFAGALAATNAQAIATAPEPTYSAKFELCAGERVTCVVDGDTFWLEGRKIRIADIDTPEVSEPKCPAEYELGMRATYRLRDLLNAGEFALVQSGRPSRDRYGRELRLIVRGGQSLGDQLAGEGLAHPWRGAKEPWC